MKRITIKGFHSKKVHSSFLFDNSQLGLAYCFDFVLYTPIFITLVEVDLQAIIFNV